MKIKLSCLLGCWLLSSVGYSEQPNFLIIITDEERFLPPQESRDLRVQQFFREHLKARTELAAGGVRFNHHYVGSTACAPSRATLFTGHYPAIHGLTQTDLAAKKFDHPDIRWLKPGDMPTMGHIFREAGYDTEYKGKWHISAERLYESDGKILETVTRAGKSIPEHEQIYLQKNLLDKFGFNGWIGPEPHGMEEQVHGVATDPNYARQVNEWLVQREKKYLKGNKKPFVLVASLVNPHDISFFLVSKLKSLFKRKILFDKDIPRLPISTTHVENLQSKPLVQQNYNSVMSTMAYGSSGLSRYFYSNNEELLMHYYYLIKLVDQEMQTILQTLKQSSFFKNTIIIWTSDHGDLLGAHNGLQQKWHNAYEETIHIPLIVNTPLTRNRKINHPVEQLSSHIDLIPTMCSLANIDLNKSLVELKRTQSRVLPLPGKDLSPLILQSAGEKRKPINPAIYFHTDDEIAEGDQKIPMVFRFLFPKSMYFLFPHFPELKGASHVESVVTFSEGRKYKFSRYFDPKKRYPEEWELYDLKADPHEQTNLYTSNPFLAEIMFGILKKERFEKWKRLKVSESKPKIKSRL